MSSTFDVKHDALPAGLAALEASAGTGKTYTLTHIVARQIIEHDVKIDRFLIVTYTRAAAAELRTRTRDAIVSWRDEIASGKIEPVVGREVALNRLEDAIADFDSATITTIHGFCQVALGSLGVQSGRVGRDTFDEANEALIREVVRDHLLRRLAMNPSDLSRADDELSASKSRETASKIEKAVITVVDRFLGNQGSLLLSPDVNIAEPDAAISLAGDWSALVQDIVADIKDRRRSAGVATFDTLISDLAEQLSGINGDAAAAALRSRFSVIMVDEFQDTDRMQWQIFHRGFADTSLANPRTLIIVGDPKQAIYRFRGADVATYISAAHTQANSLHALAVNQRSDTLLLEGLNALFAGSTFDGADRIKYETVAARDGASEMGISFPPARETPESALGSVKPIEIRWVSPEETSESTDIILTDLVDVVREHLGATLPVFDTERCEVGRRDVEPGDIGILVKSNTDGDKIALLLRKHGIPAVRSGVGSVEQSPAAVQLRALLYAMERPSDTRRGRLVANGWFFGLTPTEALEGTAILEIQQQLAAWADALAKFGVFHLWTTIRHGAGSLISIAAHGDGDRGYTDLEHLIEVLNRCLEGRPSSVDLCISILDDLASHASESEERRRRIDSDSAAVQITTIHSAKGLEYPIVLLPLVTKAPNNQNAEPFVFGYGDERLVDAGPGISWSEPEREGTPADRTIRKRLAEAEGTEEDRRIAYVALTRAKHRLVIWVRHSRGSENGGLGRLLWGDRLEGELAKPSEVTEPLAKDAETGVAKPKTAIEATACYEALAALAPLSISHRQIWMHAPGSGAEILEMMGGAPPTKILDAERVLLRPGWRAWSYSTLTDDKSAISNYGPEALRDDEPNEHSSESQSPSEPNPWDALSAGTGFGDAVHRILEEAEFALLRRSEDDTAAKASLLETVMGHKYRLSPSDKPETLRDCLLDAVRTPLDAGFNNRSIAEVIADGSLRELDFSFNLGSSPGATTRGGSADLALIATLSNQLAADDPFRSYFARIGPGMLSADVVSGYLSGSIDLVVRAPNDSGVQRYFVVDYKTNRQRQGHYDPAAVRGLMEHGNYPLQAAIYLVALQRYLRLRIGDSYDPALHLGGASYWFMRGLLGADTPITDGERNGVCSWTPSAAFINGLDNLLGGQA